MTSKLDDEGNEIINPDASNMVEALRDIGYSLESAVADIIDNSISAKASRIDIRFGWDDNHEPWLSIIDNGTGMAESELIEAMRPGSRDPLTPRAKDELGRFGLGLKTASFSQCRKLTVITSQNGKRSSRQWDLDLVRRKGTWSLRKPHDEELAGLPCYDLLGNKGTIVLWQQLDRLDLGTDKARFHQVFNERISTISEHVSLVFHRFISGEPGRAKVVIAINGTLLDPFDPFNAKSTSTTHLPEEPIEIEGKTVLFKPYILPHHSRVSPEDYERLGGKEGYLRGQGFYIYRNRRLIIHGTWFRMAHQDEMTKLARVQVDIPNTLDHLWTIDVRKSRAQPPEAVRKRLKGILERIRETAKRPYTHRGTAALQHHSESTWRRLHFNDRISYQPNPQHPLISEFRSDLPEAMRSRFDGLLTVLGAALPFAMLFNDLAERPKETEGRNTSDDVLGELAKLLFEDGSELDSDYVGQVMRTTEPFASAPEFVERYVSRMGK
jgi:hypothetical protein